MPKPVTIPNTFATATTAIPLTNLDADFTAVASTVNDANSYSNYAADTGSANAYVVTLTGVTTTYTAGLRIQFRALNANTTASTVNVNGQGAKNITFQDATALASGTIAANAIVDVMYDGTQFLLMNDPAGATGGDVVGPAGATDNAIVRFDGGTGKLVQNSAATIADTTGDITGGKYNGLTITTSTGTLTVANSKTLTANNTITLAGTDATTMTFPSTSASVARTDAGQTFTGTQVMTSPRIVTSINDTNGNEVFGVTATGSAVNELTVANAATGTGPTLSATGSDTNIDINLTPKGTGVVSTTVVYANAIYAQTIASVSSFSWNSSTSSPAASSTNPYGGGSPVITNIHRNMKRCLVADNGTVNYYLDPADSTKKADGSTSVLTGADGMVMVEIPAFYTKREVSGSIITWSISDQPLSGFSLHPAFYKDGKAVDFRYISAYDACVNTTGSTYQSGLNYDQNVGAGQSWNTGTAKLASVSGVYPACGVTRAQCRSMAANRGTGWRVCDWTLYAAVQLLYLIEYQTFYSQSAIGNGNTSFSSWPAPSGNQGDSRASEAGLSNSTGNGTTSVNTAGGAVTDYMSYRGIENLYGSVWDWVDGVIVNAAGSVSTNAAVWDYTNNSADFSDTVNTNMTQITAAAQTGFDYPGSLAAVNNFFISTGGGGSSSTYTTDFWYGSTSADRVVFVGGNAADGASAGVFLVDAFYDASDAGRVIGARIAF